MDQKIEDFNNSQNLANGTGVTTVVVPIVYTLMTADDYDMFNQVIPAFMMVLAVLGICTNVMNIYAFLIMGARDGVTASLLYLSIVDVSFNLAFFVQTLSAIFTAVEKRYHFYFSVQPLALFFYSINICFVCSVTTLLVITFITIARCMCVTMPLHFKNTFTRKRCLWVMTLIFIIVWAIHVPIFAHMGIQSKYDPIMNSTRQMMWFTDQREKVKDTVRFITSYPITFPAFFVDAICIILIAAKLRQSAEFRRQTTVRKDNGEENVSTKMSSKDIQVVQQILLVCIILLLCNLPKIIFVLVLQVESKLDMGQPYQYLYLTCSSLFSVFDAINASVNFFVYFRYNTKFRSIIKSRFKSGLFRHTNSKTST